MVAEIEPVFDSSLNPKTNAAEGHERARKSWLICDPKRFMLHNVRLHLIRTSIRFVTYLLILAIGFRHVDTDQMARGFPASDDRPNNEHAMIRVEGYEKSYRNTIAVRGLSFEVAAGSVLGVVGPNGAGKTTTMRALCGIIPPSQGRLWVAGHDVVEEPIKAKSQLAFIPDEPQLFDVLTVWEHLEFTASVYQIPNFADEARQLLEKLLDLRVEQRSFQEPTLCWSGVEVLRARRFKLPATTMQPRPSPRATTRAITRMTLLSPAMARSC